MDDEKLEEIDDDFTQTDLEAVKERLEKMEFNNEDEDEEEMVDDEPVITKKEAVKEEEKEEEEDEEDEEDEVVEKKEETSEESKSNNKLIIILCVVVALLILVILFLLLPGKKESKNESSSTGEEGISEKEKPTVKKVDIASGESYFVNDNYLYVKVKDKAYIANLDGKTIYEDADLSCSVPGTKQGYFICEDKKSDDKVKYSLKKVDDSGNITTVYADEKYGPTERKLFDEWGRVIGVMTSGMDVHLFDGSAAKLDGYTIANKKIYNGRYAIVEKSKKYGLYDVKDNQLLISPKYSDLSFLHDDFFRASQDGKEGVIDKSDSTKLGFRYNKVDYSNGLYFANSTNLVSIMDSDFKTIGSILSCNSFELTAFMDKVIVHKLRPSEGYVVVEKTGKTTNYDFKNFELFYNYVVTLKDNTLTLYDSSFNKVQDFPLGNISITLNTVAIFLEDYLVFNGNRLFNIENGQYLHDANNLSRSYQNYYVSLNVHDSVADAVVSMDDVQIGTINGIDPVEFLRADNNGIRVTNQYFIFSVGNRNLIIKK